MMVQPGFFDMADRHQELSARGDPLEQLGRVIDFEQFRPVIEAGLGLSTGTKGGRPPYDGVLMFKILLLQTLYNLSDEQIEFQIKDRLSFMRFLGLHLSQTVPDAKTVWLYRERLKEKGLIDRLFAIFDRALRNQGYLAMSGQIVDASIVLAPHQRMTKAEKDQVKAGHIPADWQANRHKLAQKDRDARWVVKSSKAKDDQGVDLAVPLFGYKNHISIDRRYGFIRKSQVTGANQSEGKVLSLLLDAENTACSVWGDTAYRTAENEDMLTAKGFRSQLHRKKPRDKPMPRHTARGNTAKSIIRSRIEHVFAAQKERLGLFIRTIGLARAHVKVTLANLVYNMQRLVFWQKRQPLRG